MEEPTRLYIGIVTHVIDPSSFWMQIDTENCAQFNVYQAAVDDFFKTSEDPVKVSELHADSCVVVCNKYGRGTGRWRRARVARVEEDSVDIFYVDYGYREIVNIKDVRAINSRFFDYLPYQAVRGGLAGVKPLTTSWTSRAVSDFTEQVLNQQVLAKVIELDQSQASIVVALYLKGQDGDWHSVSHAMLEECQGQADIYSEVIAATLSHEYVQKSQEWTNQQELHAQEENQDEELEGDLPDENGDESVGVAENNLEELEDSSDDDENHQYTSRQSQAVEDERPITAATNYDKDNMVSQLLSSVNNCSQDEEVDEEPYDDEDDDAYIQGAGFVSPQESQPIPQFNFGAFSRTMAVSTNKMQETIDVKTQRLRLEMLKQDLRKCEDELHDAPQQTTLLNYGRSDSQIGEPHREADSDIQDSITEELYNKSLAAIDDREALSHQFSTKTSKAPENKRSDVTKKIGESYNLSTKEPPKSNDDELWTEEECYKVEKQILETLENRMNCTLEMLTDSIHNTVFPESNLSSQKLATVITAILESIVRKKCSDPSISLIILETYTCADAFGDSLINTLLLLKDRFVKMTKSIRNKATHIAFANLLGMVFIQSLCWGTRICEAVQNFAMTTLERWVIFNKKRKQDQSNVIDTELMYFECVDAFIRHTHSILISEFLGQFRFWMDEIQDKLLHDDTNRQVRVALLNILLAYKGNVTVHQHSDTSVDIGVQTDSDIRQTNFHRRKSDTNGPLYKAPRGTLYPRPDSGSPHIFPDDIEPVSYSPFEPATRRFSPVQNTNTESEVHRVVSPQLQENRMSSTISSHIQSNYDSYVDPDFSRALPAVGHSSFVSDAEEDKLPESETLDCFNKKLVELKDNTIRYTPPVLKAMNPLRDNPQRIGVVLTEPYELSHDFCRMECQSSGDATNTNQSLLPSNRYSGSDPNQAVEVSHLPDSNAAKLDTLSDFLANSIRSHRKRNEQTSPLNYNRNAGNQSPGSERENEQSNAADSCKDLSRSDSDTSPLTIHPSRYLNTYQHEDWSEGILPSSHLKVSNDSDRPGIVKPDVQFPDNYFRSAPKGKKKKTKFRSLQDYEEEKRQHISIGVDEPGFDDSDEFSPEALQMYIDLEQAEKTHSEMKMIHGPRLNMSTSNATRPSLFADARKTKSASVDKPWVPGKRKCAKCGSETHVLMDCPLGSIHNDNSSFF